MRTVDDSTPLGGESIDVAARIAWTVRMARLTAPAHLDSRLRTIATQIGSSPAHLSRVETGQRRDGCVVDGYERVLGMPTGSLRAPIEVLCRTFPQLSPRDLDPGPVIAQVRELSDLTHRLQTEAAPAGEWFRWATAMAQPGNLGMPVDIFLGLAHRLASELGRTVGHAQPVRYEAFARLRGGAYGDELLTVVRETAAVPYPVGLLDLMSGIGERSSTEAVDWFIDLLRHPDEHLATGGALGLENLGSIVGPQFWWDVAPDIVAAFDASEPGSTQEMWSAHLLRLVPISVRRGRGLRPSRELPGRGDVVTGERDPENELWQACVTSSRRVCETLGLPEQPMLARLLFDIAFGPWETRAVTGYMLLDALPVISAQVGPEFEALFAVAEDPQLRERILRRVAQASYSHHVSERWDWLGSGDHVKLRAGLIAAGASGVQLKDQVILDELRGPRVASALYAAGMSEHPVLAQVIADPELPDGVRTAAGRWISTGGRLTV